MMKTSDTPCPLLLQSSVSRRTLLASAIGTWLLTGCGFRLRGKQDVPLKSMYLNLGPNSEIGATMKRSLAAQTNMTIVEERDQAEAIFELLGQNRSRTVLAVNSQGRARIYSLRLDSTFKVTLQNGVEIIPPTRLSATRELSYDEGDYNGRANEEQLLYSEMQNNIIHQIVNRLSHITAEQVERRANDIE